MAEEIVRGGIGALLFDLLTQRLVGAALPRVTAPTLLIVGLHDPVVIDLNQRALAELTGEARLEIVAGATHLFEEPGTLQQVAALATEWFRRWL